MRAIATTAGAASCCVTARFADDAGVAFDDVHDIDDNTREHDGHNNITEAAAGKAPCLFVFPAESNLTGVRYAAQLAAHVASNGVSTQRSSAAGSEWLVCVDAAKACSTGPPDARHCAADAFVLSYYKVYIVWVLAFPMYGNTGMVGPPCTLVPG